MNQFSTCSDSLDSLFAENRELATSIYLAYNFFISIHKCERYNLAQESNYMCVVLIIELIESMCIPHIVSIIPTVPFRTYKYLVYKKNNLLVLQCYFYFYFFLTVCASSRTLINSAFLTACMVIIFYFSLFVNPIIIIIVKIN